MSVIGQDDVGSRKEENAYEFSHFESLKTCGYDRRNGEKELGQLLRLASLGKTHAKKDQMG